MCHIGIEHGRPTFLADDTSIFIAGNSANEVQMKINQTINTLTEWFEWNRLIYIYKIECLFVCLFVQPIKQETVLPIPPEPSRT
jgi:hypothetical protein